MRGQPAQLLHSGERTGGRKVFPLTQNLGTSVGATAAGAVAALGFGAGFDSSTIGAEQISETVRAALERGVLCTLLLGLAVAALTLLLSGRLPAKREEGGECSLR